MFQPTYKYNKRIYLTTQNWSANGETNPHGRLLYIFIALVASGTINYVAIIVLYMLYTVYIWRLRIYEPFA